jgi:superkiller protein 3
MKLTKWALVVPAMIAAFGCATGTRPRSLDSSERARVYYEQGISLSQEERYEEALSAFKKAVDSYPDYGDAYYNMGIVYHELDRDEQAIEAYQKAIDINPRDVTARNNLGNVYIRREQLSAAIGVLEQAVTIDSTYGLARHNLALAYYLAKMYHRAEEQLEELKLLGITPDADLTEAVDNALNREKGAGSQRD